MPGRSGSVGEVAGADAVVSGGHRVELLPQELPVGGVAVDDYRILPACYLDLFGRVAGDTNPLACLSAGKRVGEFDADITVEFIDDLDEGRVADAGGHRLGRPSEIAGT